MDQRGQAERGDKQVFAACGIDDTWVNMTTRITRCSVFRPSPLFQSGRVKLQLPRGSWEALTRLAIDHHANSRPITDNFTTILVNLCTFQLSRFQFALIECEDGSFLARNFKGAILLHVLERCQVFFDRCSWQARHTI